MNNTPSTAATSRLHLPVLDGVRGLAALYVALFHALGYTGYIDTLRTQTLSIPMALLAAVLDYGTYAVPVFIVLSGFCLMLPLAQRETLHIPGGIGSFLSRRAWRILPAYYAALLLNLALIALVPVLQTQQNTSWDNKVPVTIGAIVSHLLLQD
jgi:peptidoglycan/LPS O-acetylase OafA/YrhL